MCRKGTYVVVQEVEVLSLVLSQVLLHVHPNSTHTQSAKFPPNRPYACALKVGKDMSEEAKIKAFTHSSVSGALVWDAEGTILRLILSIVIRHHLDVHRLRVQFRVVGGVVGALPLQPRQNCQLGLPLLLMPEEVYVLREEGEWLLLTT